MAPSFAERLRMQTQAREKPEALKEEKAEAKARTCPNCGAGRAESDGVKECRYCGFLFITANI